MNSDVEDLLREGMERFTADLRAPAGLVRQAIRRRRRRLALGSVTGAAAALTASGVALAAIAPGAPAAPGAGIGTTAYVVQRVSSALTAAQPGDVAQIAVTRSVTTGGKTVTTTAEEWSYGNRWRSVMYSSTGERVYDEGFSSSSVYTLVSYLTRTWAREPGLGRPAAPTIVPFLFGLRHKTLPLPASLGYGPGRLKGPVAVPRTCQPVISGIALLFQPGLPGIGLAAGPLTGIGFSAASLPAARALRNAISCGILTVAGHQSVAGIEAIELTSKAISPISETVWVTPHTYLPVRVVIRSAHGAPDLRQTADITWLQPTAQNLARLAVPVPAGFRKVSLPKVLLPMARKIGPSFLDSSRLPLLFGKPR